MSMEPWYSLWSGVTKAYLAFLTDGIVTEKTSPVPAEPKIFISNHPSLSAIFVLPHALSERVSLLIQANAFEVPVMGSTLRWAGHIPVEPGSWPRLLDAVRDRLGRGHSVVIYPEGRFSPGEGFAPPRSGAVRMAMETGAPVVPVGLYCAPKHLRKLGFHFWGRKRMADFQFGGRNFVRVGAAWYPPTRDASDTETVRHWSVRLMDQVIELVGQAKARAQA